MQVIRRRQEVDAVVSLCRASAAALLILSCGAALRAADAPPKPDAQRAFGYLKQVCAIGPRISGTEGMQRQRELLQDHFADHGAEVGLQEFDVSHPETGAPVRMANLIVSWHPETTQRVLLCCHYDTRPYPDRDPLPANRTKSFIGANDGASGVALFMELAHHLPKIEPTYGVDFVFFDGEELVYDNSRDKYFLGSEHFATEYRDDPPDHTYVCGVLVDMVADRDFRVFYEKNSLRYAPEVTKSVWRTAARLRVRSFVARRKHEVRDDHLPLNQIAEIPTTDIIDFDFPYWHTRNDIPAACSPKPLGDVARVLLTWLTEVPAAKDL